MTAQRQEQAKRARAADPPAHGPGGPTARDALAGSRVIKKLGPQQAGARRWSLRYGDDLLCVRYRVDASGAHRYTTVELVVDAAPLGLLSGSRQRMSREAAQMVAVRIRYGETQLRALARDAGARWDPDAKVWRMSKAQARELGLLERVVAV